MSLDDLNKDDLRLIRESILDKVKHYQIMREEKMRELKSIDVSLETALGTLSKFGVSSIGVKSQHSFFDDQETAGADANTPEYSWTKEIRLYLQNISPKATSSQIGQYVIDRDNVVDSKRQMDLKNRFSGTCSSLWGHKKLNREKIEGSDEYLYWLADRV